MDVPPLPDAADITRVQIANGPVRASLMTLGVAVTELRMDGFDHSLILGSPDIAPYRDTMRYFGAIVGPVANRIAGARAPLGDTTLRLVPNEGANALHGGPAGLSTRNWHLADHGPSYARFVLTWPDGDSGYPGPLHLTATYTIEDDGALRIDLTGAADVHTLCNPAFHGFWTLDGSGGLTGHTMQISADHYLPVDDAAIPLGDPAPVAGTAFDFRTPARIADDSQIDHNFCLNGEGLRPVLRLETDALALVIETDAPGLQVYDAARLNTSPDAGHEGHIYGHYSGIALEPQFWPDAPHHPSYPSISLRPGETYRQTARFRLIRKEIS
ncbi:aldose epimerase family protein [Yoonia sediminilitoris]|uniref:Aldose 1-epimerase n=1 Tax=Yoonia sediminilitoris TaxID=1286148 RepID=A0A2T6KLF2_9RHOB|nr:aldose epimerase family protein [Yoonia sediminilitoris]PUB17039.1 aldose 1-epimerase [Yoonia sediminilitoris]RCW97334.1 aldose 1-epimerase [Yoonia sediminilitoris]